MKGTVSCSPSVCLHPHTHKYINLHSCTHTVLPITVLFRQQLNAQICPV